jgi:tetratricopeptide (TPR) repeat protein
MEAAMAQNLKDARHYFGLAGGQTWEPEGLGEARVLYLEKRFTQAVEQAQAAFRRNPWLFEAKVEEAFNLAALGAARQEQGDLKAARSLYQEASLAAQLARTIGQSGSTCYLADMEWRFRWLQNPDLTDAERLAQLDAAEELADHMLKLQPDGPRALCSKAFVLIRRAATRADQGLSPEPGLQRAERLLAPAADRPECRRMVAEKQRQIQQVRERSGFGTWRPGGGS